MTSSDIEGKPSSRRDDNGTREIVRKVLATVVAGIILQTIMLGGAGLLWGLNVEKSIARIEAHTSTLDETVADHRKTLAKLADLASVERVSKLEDRVDKLAAQLNQALGELRARRVLSPNQE